MNKEEVKAQRAVIEEATKLTEEAARLADVGGFNLISIGKICRQVKNDPDLYKSLGHNTYDAWREITFKRKMSTAKTSLRIVNSLIPLFKEEEVLEMGTVKCIAFCRLPESEQVKQAWKDHVTTDDATTFKARVKAFIGGGDHKEGFVTISFPAPKSFRDETWDRVVEKGKLLNETTDTFIVVEEALASYDQDLDSSVEGFGEQVGKCFLRVPATPDSRQAILTALEIAAKASEQSLDVTLLAALNHFNS